MSMNGMAHPILSFQPQIHADAHQLGDILTITPDSHHWSEIPLNSHPRAGEKISKDQIINWLTQQTGPVAYQWQGVKKTSIQQQTQSNTSALIKKAHTALIRQLSQYYENVSARAISQPTAHVHQLSTFTVELPPSNWIAKRVCVRLRHQNTSIPIWFAVQAYQKVLVAKHQIKNQSELGPNDLRIEQKEITGLRHKPLPLKTQKNWAIKTIQAHQILTDNLVVKKPDVLKGQLVQVKVNSPHLFIASKAMALNNGYKGQCIPLKNPNSNQLFTAKITAVNQVETFL